MSRRRLTTSWMALTFLVVLSVAHLHRAAFEEQEREGRHPLSHRTRRRIQEEGLRYLSFGSSSTWGKGLERWQDAYPHLLSPTAQNAAAEGGSAVLPAACTESAVGDAIYDVITIEFTEIDDAHVVLAQRLRRRFPAASILFVRLWNPRQIFYRLTNGTLLDLPSWNTDSIDLHALELPLRMLQAGSDRWTVNLSDNNRLRSLLRSTNAHLVSLPYPEEMTFAFPQNINYFLTLFQPQTFDLTTSAHRLLAGAIQRIAERQRLLDRPLSSRDQLGDWGSGDACRLWYANGEYLEADGRNVEVAAADSHKHAIEFRSTGRLTIENHFETDRMLYLTYLTADDELDHRAFPRVRVRLNHRPVVELDPYHLGRRSEHKTRTTPVGLVAPGSSIIELEPLEESLHPFLLVGASFIAEEAKMLPIDFAMEPEPALEPPASWMAW